MTAAEIIPNMKTLNRQDLDTLRKSVEERHNTLRTQEVAGLFKTVLIGTWASMIGKGGAEVVGEVVSTNKKAVVINVLDGDKVKRKGIPWDEVHKTYQTKPDVPAAPQKPKAEPATK